MAELSTNAQPTVLPPASNKDEEAADEEKNQQQKQHPLQGLTIEARTRRACYDCGSNHQDDEEASSSSSSSDDFQDYNIDTAIIAWDQISELTHEITSSLMAKQASVLCKRFRREEASMLLAASAAKKRRVAVVEQASSTITTSSTTKTLGISEASTAAAAIVSSDDDTSMTQQSEALLSDDLSAQVDRIGRMSKLIMEIEYCQRELRKDMLAMSDHQL